jgi:putative intracellular protease/amidase
MMKIAFLIYEGFTALDVIGPYEVLSCLPEAEVCFVSKKAGPVRAHTNALSLVADYALDQVPSADIIVVSGGTKGTVAASQDPQVIDWVRAVHPTTKWTTSVCTGALILGAAGLLKGLKATTHWYAKDLLPTFGAEYVEERVVKQGKIITAAGVSSGIDMALQLASIIAGDQMAKMIQLIIEYDPQPPHNTGSISKADASTVQIAKTAADAAFQ